MASYLETSSSVRGFIFILLSYSSHSTYAILIRVVHSFEESLITHHKWFPHISQGFSLLKFFLFGGYSTYAILAITISMAKAPEYVPLTRFAALRGFSIPWFRKSVFCAILLMPISLGKAPEPFSRRCLLHNYTALGLNYSHSSNSCDSSYASFVP